MEDDKMMGNCMLKHFLFQDVEENGKDDSEGEVIEMEGNESSEDDEMDDSVKPDFPALKPQANSGK